MPSKTTPKKQTEPQFLRSQSLGDLPVDKNTRNLHLKREHKKTQELTAKEAQKYFSFDLIVPSVERAKEYDPTNAGLSERAERMVDRSQIKVGDVFIIKYRETGHEMYDIKVVVSGVVDKTLPSGTQFKYYIFNRVVPKGEIFNYKEDAKSISHPFAVHDKEFKSEIVEFEDGHKLARNPKYKLYYPGPLVDLTVYNFEDKNVNEVVEYLVAAASAVRKGTAGGLMLPDELIRKVLSYIATPKFGYSDRSGNPSFNKTAKSDGRTAKSDDEISHRSISKTSKSNNPDRRGGDGKTRKTNHRKTKKM